MSDYQPIACASHDLLEIAILRRLRLRARWRSDEGESCSGILIPLDLNVRDGAEWLTATDSEGAALQLRLDRLELAKPFE